MPDNPVTMGATAAWGCPMCHDTGGIRTTASPPARGLVETPCSTCAAHHAAVKAAVDAEREANEKAAWEVFTASGHQMEMFRSARERARRTP